MSDKPTKSSQSQQLTNMVMGGTLVPVDMAQALTSMGIDPEAVNVPVVSTHEKVAWEDLCVFGTRDASTNVSGIVVVTLYNGNLDAPQEYADYKGMAHIELVTQHGEKLFVSHAMTYAATGELTPLWGWIKDQRVPFAMRFGRIETRKRNQYVIRPMPVDIETR